LIETLYGNSAYAIQFSLNKLRNKLQQLIDC
jgi:hypothetical protein